jgi:hypothetical protein
LKADIIALLEASLKEILALVKDPFTVCLEVLTDVHIFSTPGHGNILQESIMMVERKIGLKVLTNLYIFRLPRYIYI